VAIQSRTVMQFSTKYVYSLAIHCLYTVMRLCTYCVAYSRLLWTLLEGSGTSSNVLGGFEIWSSIIQKVLEV
jgi:hypothetical protein